MRGDKKLFLEMTLLKIVGNNIKRRKLLSLQKFNPVVLDKTNNQWL